MRIPFENPPHQRGLDLAHPLIRIGHLRPFVGQLPAQHVALVVDTGHAPTNGDEPVEEILPACDRLWGTHRQDVPLENTTDNQWVPTNRVLDWPGIRAALARMGRQAAWTLELIPRDGQRPEDLVRQTRAVACAAVGWWRLAGRRHRDPDPRRPWS